MSFLIDKFLGLLDDFIERFWEHRFYNYALTDNIENAYQAVAIDDERTSFWPLLWDETDETKTRSSSLKQNVEQVWFAGMNSNVGGGYERDGMANVTLEWMLTRAERHGMILKSDVLNEVRESSNVKGRMYDSRKGLAKLYRYHPREIENLCCGRIDRPRIHTSVIERLMRGTDEYAPTQLPNKFKVVSTGLDQDDEKGVVEYEVDISDTNKVGGDAGRRCAG